MGAYAERFVFDLDGGRPSLDLVNTVSGLRGVGTTERLTEYADLLWWGRQAGLLDEGRLDRLLVEAGRHPRRAAQALATAIAAREALYDLTLAAIEDREVPAAALETVNAWIAEALRHRKLRPAGARRLEAVFDDDGDLLAFLRPVAADAADLLEHQLPSGRLRRCEESAQGRCGWLFLDETRNHSRRWCSMKECGNRAKQRRHQRRQKQA